MEKNYNNLFISSWLIFVSAFCLVICFHCGDQWKQLTAFLCELNFNWHLFRTVYDVRNVPFGWFLIEKVLLWWTRFWRETLGFEPQCSFMRRKVLHKRKMDDETTVEIIALVRVVCANFSGKQNTEPNDSELKNAKRSLEEMGKTILSWCHSRKFHFECYLFERSFCIILNLSCI